MTPSGISSGKTLDSKMNVFLLILKIIAEIYMAPTASVSGDWNDTKTWGGNRVPVPGDIVFINSDVVVSISAGRVSSL